MSSENFKRHMNKTKKSIGLQVSLLSCFLLFVVVCSICVPAILAIYLQGISYIIVTGIYLAITILASLFIINRFMNYFVKITNGINNFIECSDYRFECEKNNLLNFPNIELEKNLNLLFNKIVLTDSLSKNTQDVIIKELQLPFSSLLITLNGLSNGSIEQSPEQNIKFKREIEKLQATIKIFTDGHNNDFYYSNNNKIFCDIIPIFYETYEMLKKQNNTDITISFKNKCEENFKIFSNQDLLLTIFNSMASVIYNNSKDKVTHIEFSLNICKKVDNEYQIKATIANNSLAPINWDESLSIIKKLSKSENCIIKPITNEHIGNSLSILFPIKNKDI